MHEHVIDTRHATAIWCTYERAQTGRQKPQTGLRGDLGCMSMSPVGVIAPILQRFAITAITALPAGGHRNNSVSNRDSIFLSAPGSHLAAAELLLDYW
eukprot:5584411-Prymnesium_polylepis.1